MADADEDTIPRTGPSAEDIDLSDETQDFRFLASLTADDAKIPKRGEKDFEPHATALQSNTLAESRRAMHNALAFQRIHQPKGHTIATYHPETNMAFAYNPKGPLFSRMGQVLSPKDDPFGNDKLRGQRVWLLPEEILYLIERGTIDLRWPPSEAEVEMGEHGLPMSLQAAYAMFIGDESSHDGGLTFEKYSVFTALKRGGYSVLRAPSWNSPGPALGQESFPPTPLRSWTVGLLSGAGLWSRLAGLLTPNESTESQLSGPLVQSGLYRNYIDIYRRLAIIQAFDPSAQKALLDPEEAQTDPAFRLTYHVYRPGSTTFKKSAPGRPDYRIAVVDGRETVMPTLQQLSALLETTPYDPPAETAAMYTKLKYGYKNVILAIVDQGVTSYLRVADAAFCNEKLYERTPKGYGGKRGGKSGGRGRGRGR